MTQTHNLMNYKIFQLENIIFKNIEIQSGCIYMYIVRDKKIDSDVFIFCSLKFDQLTRKNQCYIDRHSFHDLTYDVSLFTLLIFLLFIFYI